MYTWVNGSDTHFLNNLKNAKKQLGLMGRKDKKSYLCPYKLCVPSHWLALTASGSTQLHQLQKKFDRLKNVLGLIRLRLECNTRKAAYTLITFNNVEAASR